jgi:hypothetical protein
VKYIVAVPDPVSSGALGVVHGSVRSANEPLDEAPINVGVYRRAGGTDAGGDLHRKTGNSLPKSLGHLRGVGHTIDVSDDELFAAGPADHRRGTAVIPQRGADVD